jgi:glycosyltransferase involved in cell wall biosynthesis
MVILESMAYGVPVLATRVGGIPDQVVDGETATLVTPGCLEQCVEGLERLVCDAGYRDRLGQAGYRRANDAFGPDRWAAQHIELYRKVAVQSLDR